MSTHKNLRCCRHLSIENVEASWLLSLFRRKVARESHLWSLSNCLQHNQAIAACPLALARGGHGFGLLLLTAFDVESNRACAKLEGIDELTIAMWVKGTLGNYTLSSHGDSCTFRVFHQQRETSSLGRSPVLLVERARGSSFRKSNKLELENVRQQSAVS